MVSFPRDGEQIFRGRVPEPDTTDFRVNDDDRITHFPEELAETKVLRSQRGEPCWNPGILLVH